jgi:hypothetical protein
MLNISEAHKNNMFKVKYLNVDSIITIPNGSYTAVSLRDWINSYFTTNIIPIAFNYDKSTNKYWLITSLGIVLGDLVFYPLNCASLFGFIKESYDLIYPNSYYSETFVNMLPYSKILLTCDLSFDTNIQYNLKIPYNNANSGISNIISWIPRDVPPFSTINYININNTEIEISNKNLKSIQFGIMNEYQEFITDAPISYIHFQIITYDNTKWIHKFYNLLNDISYYLLSSYFAKKYTKSKPKSNPPMKPPSTVSGSILDPIYIQNIRDIF